MDTVELFEQEKISKVYLKLTIPLVISMLITLIYNLADTYFVSMTGNSELVAGVSLCAPVFMFLMAIGNIFGQGGSSLISRLLGAGNLDEVRKVSSFCFYGALFSGVIIGTVMIIIRTPFVYVLGADEMTYGYASGYYFWLVLGAPFVIVSFIHSNLLRSEGMAKESMIGTVSGALVNIVLDPVFIIGLGMGATGAAIASVIGYIFSDTYLLIVVLRRSRNLSVDIRRMIIPSAHLTQIFGIGVPAAIVNIMSSGAMILLNQYLHPYGNTKIAAMGIVQKIIMIATLIITGLCFGGQPLFGYFFGKRDSNKLKELTRFCVMTIESIAFILTVILFALAPVLIAVFLDDPEIIESGSLMLRLQVITTVCVGFITLSTIIVQSAGQILKSFILSICRQGVIFLLTLIIGRAIAGYNGIIAAQAAADLITTFIALALLRSTLNGVSR